MNWGTYIINWAMKENNRIYINIYFYFTKYEENKFTNFIYMD